MSIMRCEKHGHWDSDFQEECERCQEKVIDKAERPEPVAWLHCDGGTMHLCELFTPDKETVSEWCLLYGPEVLDAYDRMAAERDKWKKDWLAESGDTAELTARLAFEVARAERAEAALAKLRAGMMEPSEEMLRAGWNADLLNLNGGLRRFLITFKAMSAVLLREAKP